jgi:hypothetical protein
MPIHNGHDSFGRYYKYGPTGKKYHYITGNSASRMRARNKALKQMRAIKVASK